MTRKINRTVECPQCDRRLSGERGLKMHIAQQHKPVGPETDLQPHRHYPSIVHMGDCSICGNAADSPIHNIGETK